MWRKRTLLHGLLLVLLLSLLLPACGENTPIPAAYNNPPLTQPPGLATASGPVTIKWAFWGDKTEVAINQQLIDQFEKLHPDIKVEPVHEDLLSYFTLVERDWVKTGPDVMLLTDIPTYAKMGMLENLEPYIAAEKNFNLEDFYPNLLEMNRYNNTLYGLPRDNGTKVIYVNLKMLEDAGLSLPAYGWSWQDLLLYARKLTMYDASGNPEQYGFAFEIKEWWRLWVWQNGAEIYDNFIPPEPPAHFVMNTPAAAEAIQFFADLINKEKVTPGWEAMSDGDNITRLFAQGKLAMAFGSHAVVPTYSQVSGLKWDVAPLPMGKVKVNMSGGAAFSIHKNSKNIAAAWEFVKFLSSEMGQGFFMESGVMVPARQSVQENNIYLRNSRYSWKVFVQESKLGRPTPLFYSSNTISKRIDKELLPVWKGEDPAADVLAKLPAIIDPMLNDLRRSP